MSIFDISNKEIFTEKFKQCCSGSGHEGGRIATLHSSSLCALLFFYNITEYNPWIMKVDEGEIVFTESVFEYQNAVINGRNPSNIDVVLIGRRKNTDCKVVFFLESKFAEYYLNVGQTLEIAQAYREDGCKIGKRIYDSKTFEEFEMVLDPDVNEKGNFRITSKCTCYLEGIKQMISHYIGVRNAIDNPCGGDGREAKKNVCKAICNGADVLLGEILFTNKIGELEIGRIKDQSCYESYRTCYKNLSEVLNRETTADGVKRLTVLADLLTYDSLINQTKIESRIKEFYFGGI